LLRALHYFLCRSSLFGSSFGPSHSDANAQMTGSWAPTIASSDHTGKTKNLVKRNPVILIMPGMLRAAPLRGAPDDYDSGFTNPVRFAQTVVLATLDQNVGLSGDWTRTH
jgi:hypothetical protein